MENPCKPPIEEKLYSCPRLSDASGKIDSAHAEVRQVECGKGFGLFGGKKSAEATPPPLIPEEMAPPPYSDLGKKAQDVFNKGYHFGLVKLDIKTKSASGVEFATGGSSNQESGKVAGSLETKYKVKDYGLTFTEKWTTDNTLSTEMAVQDQLVPGLKLSSALNFAPQTGGQYHIQDSNVNVEFNTEQDWGKLKTNALWRPLQKTGNVKAAYVNKQVAINADSDFRADGPIVSASAVVGYQGWLAGYLAGYDVNNKKLTKSNFALGFTSGDFTLHSNVNDGQDFGGSIYQKLNPQLETGISLNWSSGSSNTKFGIGAKYDLDQEASLRVKVNNQSQIGLGYQQRLRQGVTLTLSTLIDGKNFNQGGHKIGLALELDA
ncbi:voltage-dependent anion-selective channel isoform X3 [Dendroctonus ponderosae]|uniref:Voltage-dependent anion-selective channel protein 3 n=1 Tax=Dendroctonus ponderosae TaxID=77166 RepID=A0AAR5QAQ0_DENPD|nr:voltage-dependent anion-selective channel isoform X3 [Dendroctonus ponderosae]